MPRQRTPPLPTTAPRLPRHSNRSTPHQRTSRQQPPTSHSHRHRPTHSSLQLVPQHRNPPTSHTRPQPMEAATRTTPRTAAPTAALTSRRRHPDIDRPIAHAPTTSNHPGTPTSSPAHPQRRTIDHPTGHMVTMRPSTIDHAPQSPSQQVTTVGEPKPHAIHPSPGRSPDTGTHCGSGSVRVWGFRDCPLRRSDAVAAQVKWARAREGNRNGYAYSVDAG